MSDESTAPTLNEKFLKLLSDAQLGVIDAPTAIVGMKEHYDAAYGSNFRTVMTFLEAMDAEAKQSKEHLEGVRGQMAQVVGNQPIITQHLARQDDKLAELAKLPQRVEDAIGGLSMLASEFSQTSEVLTEWRGDMDTWRQGVDRELASFRQSRDESIAERQQLQKQLKDSQEDRKLIHEELREAKQERADMAAQLERVLIYLKIDSDRHLPEGSA